MPEGITTLQRLRHLQLGNCVTAPLPQSISRLTQLTCLTIIQHEQDEDEHDVLDRLVVRLACAKIIMLAC